MKQCVAGLLNCLFVCLGFQGSLLAAPANDSFSAPTVVTGLPATATGSNVDATLQVDEPLPTAYTIEPFQPAEASVWFTWTSPVTGSVQIDTLGSDFDTIIAVWTGSTLTALSEIDSNAYYFGSRAAVFIDVVQGTAYRIAIYGNEDARGEISLSIKNDTTSRISGVVTGSDGTTPLAGIDATAFFKVGEGSSAYWEYAHYGITRPDGSYTIRGLKSDTYRVGFADYENKNYQDEYYDNAESVESGTDIVVTTNTTATGIHASLELASKITGIVTGPDGSAPLAGVYVSAYQFSSATNEWNFANSTSTLPDGSYQVGSLSPGTYRVEFEDFSGDHLSEYYDNATTLNSASSITVVANTTVPNINASLATASKITGTVTGPDGITPLAGILVFAYRFDSASNSWNYNTATSTLPDGTYQLGSFVPGIYRLKFDNFNINYLDEYYDNAADLASATSINLAANTTVPDINASLALAPKIAGSVTGPNGTTPLAGITVTAYRLYDSATAFWYPIRSATTAADGSYRLESLQFGGLPSGPYRVGFSDPGGNYAYEFYSNAADVASATSIVIPENTTASGIDASMNLASRITGTITGPDGTAPLAGIVVRAYLSARSGETVRTAMTLADGSYQLGGLAAGTYQIGFSDPDGNYLAEYYNNVTSVFSATSITVGEAVTVSGFNASLSLASKITGIVTGPNGTTPLSGINVTVYQSVFPYFQQSFDSIVTLADGSYRVGGLVAGTYRIGFRDPSGNHIPEYYNNALDVNTATNITVGNATTVSGINASLVLPAPPEITGFRKTGATSCEILFMATPGLQGQLQESTSLTSWSNVGGLFTCQHGVNVRSLSSSEPKKFWRVKIFP